MQLKRVILPEILLGRRGHPNAIQFYKYVTKGIEKFWDPQDQIFKWYIPAFKDPGSQMPDENLANHHLISKMFRENNGKVYYVGKDFAQALAKMDREIPVDVLPRKFVGYIQFADDSLIDDTGAVDGALVWIDTFEGLGYIKDPGDEWGDLGIAVSYGNTGVDPEMGPPSVCKFSVALRKLHTVGKLYDEVGTRDNSTVKTIGETIKDSDRASQLGVRESRLPVLRAIINALVYIHSADPEIMKLAPLSEFSNKQRVEVKKKQPIPNHLSIPITLLHWNFHAQRVYSVDQTTVSAHLRWQRFGIKSSLVKLILIDEHSRTYHRKETQNETE